MAEDNVVRPDFRRKRNGSESPPVMSAELVDIEKIMRGRSFSEEGYIGPLNPTDLKIAKLDVPYILANYTFVEIVRDKVEDMIRILFGQNGLSKKDENILVRRVELKATSLEKICYSLRLSEKKQWLAQMQYFGALALEFQCRVNHAKALIPDGAA